MMGRPRQKDESDRPGPLIKSVAKALRMLDLFTPAQPLWTLTEISRALGIPHSTAFALLATLAAHGLIDRDGDGKYFLGVRAMRLTPGILLNVELRDRGAPFLRALADRTHLTVNLAAHDGNGITYLYSIETPQRVLTRTVLGHTAPHYCTAVGKAILAFLPEGVASRIVEECPLARCTSTTITDSLRLREELALIRQRGYAVDRGERNEGERCIGMPIRNRSGWAVAACSVSGSVSSIGEEDIPRLAQEVAATADVLSRLVGFVPEKGDALVSQLSSAVGALPSLSG
ncbi:MAG: IclR family transcriptional regulator [Dehalococcoidales bacterium]|nr:IclR family transcriptional regulator [Dehalococcoidales bacterium]